jgi:glycyl-tRNA synthetase (class II)
LRNRDTTEQVRMSVEEAFSTIDQEVNP